MQFGGQTPLSLAKPLQDALEKSPIVAASGASTLLDNDTRNLTYPLAGQVEPLLHVRGIFNQGRALSESVQPMR